MSSDPTAPGDGVPCLVQPEADTARILVLTRPRLDALVRRLCEERGERPPLPAALAAMPDDDVIALVRRLRDPAPRR
jgi:hypothetical protein